MLVIYNDIPAISLYLMSQGGIPNPFLQVGKLLTILQITSNGVTSLILMTSDAPKVAEWTANQVWPHLALTAVEKTI